MALPKMPNPSNYARVLDRLHVPVDRTLKVVIDTDTYNEVDDQFAIVYALQSSERLRVEALYAAPFFWPGTPFFNSRSISPSDGMERSYEEIGRVLSLLDQQKLPSFRGSRNFLESVDRPQESDAVTDLIERVLASDEVVYVLALAALTNIASAIMVEPRIKDRTVIVWLGGHALNWHDTVEFNLSQDVPAARVVFDSGVPVIHIPCLGVASHLATTSIELDAYIRAQSEIGTYLADIVRNYYDNSFARSKIIWDISTVAHVINPDWVPVKLVNSPILSADCRWSVDKTRHPMFSAYWIDRDRVFGDLFEKIARKSTEVSPTE